MFVKIDKILYYDAFHSLSVIILDGDVCTNSDIAGLFLLKLAQVKLMVINQFREESSYKCVYL